MIYIVTVGEISQKYEGTPQEIAELKKLIEESKPKISINDITKIHSNKGITV